jgi:hypothetical protein
MAAANRTLSFCLLVLLLEALCVSSRNVPPAGSSTPIGRRQSGQVAVVETASSAADTANLDTAAGALECIAVAQPVLGPSGPVTHTIDNSGNGIPRSANSCTVLLMDHQFAWSYGKPFIGTYRRCTC